MHLIIGGAYQGKTEYACEHFGIEKSEIVDCTEDGGIDLSAKCIRSLQKYVLGCIRSGKAPFEAFERDESWKNTIILCEDIFCGVVPVDPEMRAWREATGRLLNKLTPLAESVTRMFCGIPQQLK